jgi:hypothetical protein
LAVFLRIAYMCIFVPLYARISAHVEKYLHQFLFVNIFYQIANFYFAYFQCFTPYFQNRAKKSSSFCRLFRIFSVPLQRQTKQMTFGGVLLHADTTQRYSVKMYPI